MTAPGFFKHTYLGGNCPPVSKPFSPAKAISSHRSQKSFEQRTEITFDRRLVNVAGLVIQGLYCPPTQNLMEKTLHEITEIFKASLNLFLLSLDPYAPTVHHYIT